MILLKEIYIQLTEEYAKPDIGAGAMICCSKTGRFLLQRRSKNCDEAGTWCCPGGGVSEDETPEEACVREVKEECGADISNPKPLHVFKERGKTTFHNFVGFVENEFVPKKNSETDAHKWVSLDEFENHDLHFGIKDILDNKNAVNILKKCSGNDKKSDNES